MNYQSDKKRFYIFLDAHNALNDIKYFNMIKRKGSDSFYDEVINPHSMEIFNTFLKQLGRYYNVEMVLILKIILILQLVKQKHLKEQLLIIFVITI